MCAGSSFRFEDLYRCDVGREGSVTRWPTNHLELRLFARGVADFNGNRVAVSEHKHGSAICPGFRYCEQFGREFPFAHQFPGAWARDAPPNVEMVGGGR